MIVSKPISTHNQPRKKFVNGVADKEILKFKWWKVVKELDTSKSLLPVYESLREIESKNLPYIHQLGTVKPEHSKYFRRTTRGANPHMVNNSSVNALQIDIDGKKDGSDYNLLGHPARVEVANAAIPFLNGLEVVWQLSNKGGIQGYEDYLALRAYIRLDDYYPVEWLYDIFRNIQMGMGELHLDAAVVSDSQILLAMKPELVNTPVNKEIFENGLHYQEGKALDPRLLANSPVVQKGKELLEKVSAVRSTLQSNNREEVKAELHAIADSGYYDKVIRNTEHFRLLSYAEHVLGDGDWMVKVIASNSKIIGSLATPEKLEQELDRIKNKSREVFLCNDTNGASYISKKQFDHKTILNVPYLNRDCIQELLQELRRLKYKAQVCVKSGHGTAKTTGLIKIIEADMEEYYGREITAAYLNNRRANCYKASIDLSWTCYLDANGKPDVDKMKNSTKLVVGEHSLLKMLENKATGELETFHRDLAVYDEVENAHTDAATLNNTNQEHLKNVMGEADLQLYLDADLAGHTYSLCKTIQEESYKRLLLIENTYSHMDGANCKIWKREIDIYHRIVEDLRSGKKVVLAVDYSDNTKNPWLSTLTQVINEMFGKKIAVHVDRSNAHLYRELFETPDVVIARMVEEGVRLFTYSPKIVTGWRCTVPFDIHYSVQREQTLTAPQIVQQSQRFVGIKEYNFYIAAKSTFSDLEQLEAGFYTAHAKGEDLNQSGGLGKILFDRSFTTNRTQEAEKTIATNKSSTLQHLVYILEDLRAIIEYVDNLEEPDEELKLLLKDEKGKQAEIKTKKAYDNINHRRAVLAKFKDVSEVETWQDFQDLMVRNEFFNSKQDKVIELLSMLFANENERFNWQYDKPVWARDYQEHYYPIGTVLDRTLEHAISKEELMNVLKGKGTITLEVDALKNPAYTKLLVNLGEGLAVKASDYFRKGTKYPTFIQNIAKMLDLNVVSTNRPNTDVVKAKTDLVEYYLSKSPSPITKKKKKSDMYKAAEKVLLKRYRDGRITLNKVEHTYIRDTGKYIVIEPKENIHKVVASHINHIVNFFDDFSDSEAFAKAQEAEREKNWKRMSELSDISKKVQEELISKLKPKT